MENSKAVVASGEGKIELSFDDGKTYLALKDTTSVSISSDQNRADWVPFDNGGWQKNKITSKSLAFSIEKKYNPLEEADKELLALTLTKTAYEHNYAKIKFTMPLIEKTATTPASLEADVSLKITDILSKGSEDIMSLNFEAQVNGEPKYTEEVSASASIQVGD